MNRTLEHTTMIIIALLLSIVFTGQHYSHAEVLLRIKVDIVYSIQSDIYRERYIEPIETELLKDPTSRRTRVRCFRLCGGT